MKFFTGKLFKITLITIVVLVVLYTVVGFYILPGIVKPKLIDGIASTTGRKVTLGELHINPFELSATANDFELFDKDNQSLFGAKRLFINFQLSSLFNGTITFAEISIDSPHVHVKVYPDSSTNYSHLMPEEAPSTAQPSQPKILVIEKFSIRQGIIFYEDRTRPDPLVTTLDSLSFSLNNFTTKPANNGLYSFDAQTAHGERLAWRGTLNVTPPRSIGSFTIAGLQGHTLWEFMQDRFDFEITKGELGIQGQYDFSMKAEKTEFHIHNTSVSVRSLTIVDKKSQAEALTIPTANVGGIEFGYQEHAVRINTVSADSGSAFTTRQVDGNYGLKLLLLPHPSKDNDNTKWDFIIDTIRLHGWKCNVSDLNTTPPTKLLFNNTSFTLEHFHKDTDEPSRMAVTTGMSPGATISINGTITNQPITANLTLDCKGISLPAFQSYVDKYSRLQILSGLLGLKGEMTYKDHGETAAKTFAGEVTVSTFRGVDPVLHEDFLRWNQLDLKQIQYKNEPSTISMKEIVADQAYLRFILDSTRTSNVHHIMLANNDTSGTTTQDTTKHESKSHMQIGDIKFVNGSMNFADLSLNPNFATGIQQLNGTITDLNSDNLTHAEVDLEGKVDKYAPVTIKGQINPLSDQMYTDIAMKFENIELTTFTPYSGKFAGYRIDKGKLSVELNYKLNQNYLKAENRIIVDQLTLGDKVDGPDVTSLPVKLAIALLKDQHGVIDLDLPVEGNLNDPQFSVFPIIMKVLLNLITKAVTAPFKLIGSLFGGSSDDLSYLQFAPGSATISSDQESKIDGLAKGLEARPELQLDIRGIASDTADGRALAVQSILKQVRGVANTNSSEDLSDDEQNRLLAMYKTTFQSDPELLLSAAERATLSSEPILHHRAVVDKAKQKLYESVKITGQDIRTLALNRASAIKEKLVYEKKVDDTRIFLLDPQLGAALTDGMVQLPLALNAK